MILRRATAADAPQLVDRWAEMFAELGTRDGPIAVDQALRDNFAGYLARKLPADDFFAWVVVEGTEVLSTAALITYEIPGRGDVSREGYVINVFTVARARGQGLAQKLMTALLQHARTLPLRKVWLRTAPKARELYLRSGFAPHPEFMELDVRLALP